ncbi:MAG: hypothetical protein LBK98_00345 [Peptococcaceae bacterium]|jgi:hypothetical protein|nr:hypothetical protein [Peptococcaceae bacterium]
MAFVVLGLWLVCMYAITSVTAESLYVNYWNMGRDFMDSAWSLARFSDQFDGDGPTLPGHTAYALWQAVLFGELGNNYGLLYDADHFQILRGEKITSENAMAVFDPAGNAVAHTSNFFMFAYYDEEQAVGDNGAIDGYAVCVLDRQMEPADARHRLEQSFLSGIRWDALYYRLTGVLEDGYFTIIKGEYLLDPKYAAAGETGWKDLISFLPYGDAAPEGAATVTLYTQHVDARAYAPGRSFRYGGEVFNDIREFLLRVGPGMETWQATQLSLSDFVYLQNMYYYDWSKGEDNGESTPELEYRLAVAMLASPWRSAMAALRNAYIVTFALAAIGALWLRRLLGRDARDKSREGGSPC